MTIAYAITLFFLSFLMHLIWWRISMPIQTTCALLLTFLGVELVAISFFLTNTLITLSLPEIAQFFLLYTSYSLVYIILYSAIEQQSPTLAIVHYIHQRGKQGCDNMSLNSYLKANSEIKVRLNLMQQTGWIYATESGWCLTKKGRWIARIFECAAIFFGLSRGG